MSQFIDRLREFNSKERFFLVGQILGNPAFVPSVAFRKQLGKELDLQIPENAFAAMDYHLDWIYASLFIVNDPPTKRYQNEDNIIKAQQEDIDFLIAYDEGNTTHIILIEAKGVTGWTNKQMKSKAKRLREIFGEDGRRWENVQPHFILMSPSYPQRLDTLSWPQWMLRPIKNGRQVAWTKLGVPDYLRVVCRCDQFGREDKTGGFWKVTSRKNFG